MRQKMKKFRRMVQDGRMKLETVRLSAQCWISYALNFDAIGTVKSIMGLIYDIFGCEEAHRILSVKNPKHGGTYKKRLYIVRYEKALFQCRKGG